MQNEARQAEDGIWKMELRPSFAWMLVIVMASASVALLVSFQLGFFLLLFAGVGWWVWRNPEEGLLFFVISAPLLSMFKATQTIGTVTLVKDVVILALFARVVLVPLLTKTLPYRRSMLFGPAAALAAWTALETLRADSLPLGILRARDIGLYMLLSFAVLYLPHTAPIWKRRLAWFTAAVGATIALAGYQWFFAADSAVLRFDPGRSIWIPRISSTFGHPSVYGEYLVAAAALFASCVLFLKDKFRIWFGILFLVMLPVIFLTYSRAVWVGFVAAMGVMGIMWVWNSLIAKKYLAKGTFRRPERAWSSPEAKERGRESGALRTLGGVMASPRAKYFLAIFAGLIVILVLVLLLRFTPAGPLLRSAFDPTYKSNEERLEFAARLVAPMSNLEAIIGRGLGDVVTQQLRSVDVVVEDITAADSRNVQLAKDSTLVDNQYLKTFVEMGLIGWVIYFWLFWRFAKGCLELLRKPFVHIGGVQRVIGLWGLAFLTSFVVQGLFIDIWDIFPTNAMFWIVGGLVSAALTAYTDSNETRHSISSPR